MSPGAGSQLPEKQSARWGLSTSNTSCLPVPIRRARLTRNAEVKHTYLEFEKNDAFVFRESLFRQLDKHLPLGSQRQKAVLWGLGGSG